MKSFLLLFLSWWSWLLTFTSGFANVSTLLILGAASTHHTGHVSKLSITLLQGKPDELIPILMVILSFFLGAALCGILFHEQQLRPQKRYGVLLISLGTLLLLVHSFFKGNIVLYTISFLSGAQNGMFLYIHNFLTRTTHITGYLTDTAFAFGRVLRGYREDWRKFHFNLLQIVFFFLGGLAAAALARNHLNNLISIIGFLYIIGGLVYFIARSNHLFASETRKNERV